MCGKTPWLAEPTKHRGLQCIHQILLRRSLGSPVVDSTAAQVQINSDKSINLHLGIFISIALEFVSCQLVTPFPHLMCNGQFPLIFAGTTEDVEWFQENRLTCILRWLGCWVFLLLHEIRGSRSLGLCKVWSCRSQELVTKPLQDKEVEAGKLKGNHILEGAPGISGQLSSGYHHG